VENKKPKKAAAKSMIEAFEEKQRKS